MSEALVWVREVADHLQTPAVQSLKYESKSDRGRELALFLGNVKDVEQEEKHISTSQRVNRNCELSRQTIKERGEDRSLHHRKDKTRPHLVTPRI
ncbi:myosin heavy chain, clone 203-like protein [Gossypium australe]|uniref:Myosin heavy chain, clone 203-like protein n=1 Tax=Gossypium australe TaxID=47621 RepID=A0A5B6WLE1_9ROSI|nr:myosin heavy chain, clone 203-like protein [Gossypium australe]